MIRINVGNPGSGKTLCAVRSILNKKDKAIYTNIILRKNPPYCHSLERGMIVKKNIVKTITKKDGTVEPVYEYIFNSEFWTNAVKNNKNGMHIIIDESHTLFESRASMTKINRIAGDFLALSRKILGSSDGREGELTLITQLPRRLDVWCHDMAREINYHRCHYTVYCSHCDNIWREHNDMPGREYLCRMCGSAALQRYNHCVEIFSFKNSDAFQQWNDYQSKTYFKREIIKKVSVFFDKYNTYQFQNLIS